MLEEYNRTDSNGKYRLLGLRNRNQAFNPQTRPKLYFALFVNPLDGSVSTEQSGHHTDEVYPDAPDGTKTCWTWSKQKVAQENFLLLAEKSGKEWRIFRKDYLFSDGTKATTLAKSLWDDKEFSNDYGRNAIKQLFGSSIMDFPKSSNMLERLVTIGTVPNAIILDFFSGSATTAHAVMQLNAEDGGNRKFIMVQLPEECPPDSEAAKAGYANICEIGKERIRRAGEKILQELTSGKGSGDGSGYGVGSGSGAGNVDGSGGEMENPILDVGFRVLKLDSTNMKDVYYGADEYDQGILTNLISNIKEDRSDMDLLYGCLLEWGLPLSLPHTSEQIGDVTVHTYNNGDLIACFATKISEAVVREIAKRKPLRVVFRDSSFADAPAKINVEEIFKLMAPNTTVKVL